MKKALIATCLLTQLFVSCSKDTDHPAPVVPPPVEERPLLDYAFKTDGSGNPKDGFSLNLQENDYPTEYGMEFTASKNGILYAAGLKMPQAATYTLSVWEVASHKLLWQDQVNYTPSGFTYVDLLAIKKDIPIEKNKKYMVGVFVPRAPAGNVYPAYWFWKPGTTKLIPITQGHITFTGNYFTKTDVPVYPDVLILHFDVINGLVDIGYYATEY